MVPSVSVRIFQPSKTAMQSGRGKTRRWQMQFEEMQPKFVDPLTGWVGQRDTQQQLSLQFDTQEAAVAYAEKMGYHYVVETHHTRHIAPKSYADNFSYYKIST